MSLDAFVFYLAGVAAEALLLWEGGRRVGSRLAGRFKAPGMSFERYAALGLVGLRRVVRKSAAASNHPPPRSTLSELP